MSGPVCWRPAAASWADVHYLEGLLIGARSRGLDTELIERLAAAVDTGHELTVLLAGAARSTAAAHTAGH